MLSRARYEDEEDMVIEGDDVGTNFYTTSYVERDHYCYTSSLESFFEDMYDGEWLHIGHYLSTLTKQEGWSDQEFKRIRRKAYGCFLQNGHLWKHPKKRSGTPQRVVCNKEDQRKLMKEFHESLWDGHRGIWATFAKIKERYWWKGMYRDCGDLCYMSIIFQCAVS